MTGFKNCLVPALAAGLAFASTTTTWEMNSYQDFLRGRFSNVALSRDGRLSLAPRLDTLFVSDQPEVWAVAEAPDGSVYLGTGHRGKIYRIDASGRATLVWTAEQPEVFALAVDGNGVLFAGTSPDGKIYRIQDGQAAEFFAPGAKYIWSIVVAPDGSLFAGTGSDGKIYHVQANGKGQVYFESGQAHITSLAIDAQGRLLAGSEPNGILYRLTGPNKAFVLYDANLPEIRSILPAGDGTIYAAALGGSTTKRSGNLSGTSVGGGNVPLTAPATSITVTDTSAQSGPDLKPPKPDQSKPAIQTPVSPVVQTASALDIPGIEKSAIYRIRPDNTVETVWTSKDENVYDIAALDNRLIFSTDLQGRLYRLTTDLKATLVAETGEGEAIRLLSCRGGLIAATGNMGKLYRLTANPSNEGYYESPVHDANTVARWGRLSWRADLPAGSQIAFRTRTGNSARPDSTWSDWSQPISDASKAVITSPNARYIQWRAEFKSVSGQAPSIDSVTAAYLPQNTPPVLRSINVSSQPKAAAAQASATPAAAANSAFSITVTDTGDSPQTSAGTPTQTLARGPGQQTQIVWQADDPDGDRLIYAVYFRGEEEREWKLLRGNFFENTLNLDADVLADGRYYFRVVASDRPSNPAEYAREADLTSAPVLIDNTPPVVRLGTPVRNSGDVDLQVDAADQTSPLRRCEYSLDAGPWYPVEAADGVTDSAAETFRIHLENLRPGEHLLVVRVYDSAGNAGLSKVVIR
jgi:hypothetical protein